MPEITCSAHTCAYNQEGYCDKDTIKIDTEGSGNTSSNTCCDSFEDQCHCTGKSGCSNCAGENASVDCSATDCVYNHNRECDADRINVEGHDAHSCSETCCETFQTAK